MFEVVHKSLHAVKLGRELRQVVFQHVELPVEVPHGVRQGPDPGKEICDSHARLGFSANSDKPEQPSQETSGQQMEQKYVDVETRNYKISSFLAPDQFFLFLFLIICEEKSP